MSLVKSRNILIGFFFSRKAQLLKSIDFTTNFVISATFFFIPIITRKYSVSYIGDLRNKPIFFFIIYLLLIPDTYMLYYNIFM